MNLKYFALGMMVGTLILLLATVKSNELYRTVFCNSLREPFHSSDFGSVFLYNECFGKFPSSLIVETKMDRLYKACLDSGCFHENLPQFRNVVDAGVAYIIYVRCDEEGILDDITSFIPQYFDLEGRNPNVSYRDVYFAFKLLEDMIAEDPRYTNYLVYPSTYCVGLSERKEFSACDYYYGLLLRKGGYCYTTPQSPSIPFLFLKTIFASNEEKACFLKLLKEMR